MSEERGALGAAQECNARHWERIAELHGEDQRRTQPQRSNPWSPRAVMRKARKAAKAGFFMILAVHPLIAIVLTPFSAALSRAERIMLQVNTFIILLALALFFSYTKAVNCCIDAKDHLGCPDSGDVFGACLGFSTCPMVFVSGKNGLRPAELPAWDWEHCDAFPTDDLFGRLLVVVIMVMTLLPINAFFQALFTLTTSMPVPLCWRSQPTRDKQTSKRLGPLASTALHIVATLLYAFLETFSRFNKAVALLIVSLVTLIVSPVQHISQAFRRLYKRFKVFTRWSDFTRIQHDSKDTMRAQMLETIQQYVAPAVDGSVEVMGYLLLVSFWGCLTWVLAAQGAILRKTMAEDAQVKVIELWVIAAISENFGVAAVHLMGMKLGAVWIGSRFQAALDGQFRIATWYEEYVVKTFEQELRNNDDGDEEEYEGDAADAEMDTGDDGGGLDVAV
ncbi:hypothetical protein CYMTET_49574 [Cymbomonas tetramitiformis]|uniref:Uncharacterized protein n=1 Tax=Cymbomonas tetramitiformis TaxID=36881 RepID=A0AAE0BRJ9_9CHLO|nr:hypothetical protein CYMTET_49574 [Cymbomonas tetramitiformis]